MGRGEGPPARGPQREAIPSVLTAGSSEPRNALSVMPVGRRGATCGKGGGGGVCVSDLLPYRWGRARGALIFDRPLGAPSAVLFIMAMGVTLSVWIPSELQGYTPRESQMRMFSAEEARVTF